MSFFRAKYRFWLVLAATFLVLANAAEAARIKDLANIRGVRNNQLIGFGLVVGLAGTGDSATNIFFSIQTIVNMLKKMGVTVPSARITQLKFKNVATVMVTAELPPFAKQGDHLDLVVSSLGDSKSLQGGTLLMTPLKGPDGKTYAVGQGPLSIGGFAVQGAARGVQKNHLNVARVVNGGMVEQELPMDFNNKNEIMLSLEKYDFTTAQRITKAINDELKDALASIQDGRAINVKAPPYYAGNMSAFINKIEGLQVEPDTAAKVIIDERTGTVVMGENVRISTVAVAHGNLLVQIRETAPAAQPAPPPAQGAAAIGARTRVVPDQGQDRLLIVSRGVALGDVVNGLNAIGVSPADLIAILQAIKAAGALHAELEII
ncbi:MAG: flagellar basal body P-ring protein FlgI [Nitrospinae bacterium]|nr:flagellar basal body P-ring protein FlgI [Nitrospinota bacterium]